MGWRRTIRTLLGKWGCSVWAKLLRGVIELGVEIQWSSERHRRGGIDEPSRQRRQPGRGIECWPGDSGVFCSCTDLTTV